MSGPLRPARSELLGELLGERETLSLGFPPSLGRGGGVRRPFAGVLPIGKGRRGGGGREDAAPQELGVAEVDLLFRPNYQVRSLPRLQPMQRYVASRDLDAGPRVQNRGGG